MLKPAGDRRSSKVDHHCEHSAIQGLLGPFYDNYTVRAASRLRNICSIGRFLNYLKRDRPWYNRDIMVSRFLLLLLLLLEPSIPFLTSFCIFFFTFSFFFRFFPFLSFPFLFFFTPIPPPALYFLLYLLLFASSPLSEPQEAPFRERDRKRERERGENRESRSSIFNLDEFSLSLFNPFDLTYIYVYIYIPDRKITIVNLSSTIVERMGGR